MTVLAVEQISKFFPGVHALDRVDFHLHSGSIHALLGENGAGKSTLIKILTGVYTPEAGTLTVNGKNRDFASPRDALAAGIGAVHQERNLIPYFSVGENIMLERLPHKYGLVRYHDVWEQAQIWLDTLDVRVDARTSVNQLSVAQVQLVEIAKALAQQTHILLLDEPTASLTAHETERLFELLRKLRDDGTALVFVSHKLEEVFELCDQVTVLRDGRNACDSQPLAALDRQQLVKLMIGRDEQIPELPQRRFVAQPSASALQLQTVATAQGHQGINFSVYPGEILGLYGLVGSGRSELAKALIGLDTITAGQVFVEGRPVTINSVNQALSEYRIGYISEDRKQEGLILMHSVTENIAVTIWDRLKQRLGLISDWRERRTVQPLAERLDIRTPSLAQTVGYLSGGNQQKVSVAKWLAAQARILIIDEPTVGIDIKTKTYLHELIWQLAAEGTAVLLISSDMPEMIVLADRILVMNDFRLVGEIENSRDYAAISYAIMACIQDHEPHAERVAEDHI